MLKWTKEEDELLKQIYQSKKQEIISHFPYRSVAAINIRASKLGLKKIRNEYCQSKLDILLKDTHESFYWIGFILADGSFDFKSFRLTVVLANKDAVHLNRLAEYLQTKTTVSKKEQICLSCQDKYIVPQIINKFDFKQSKTYNPPNFIPFPQDFLLSLLIGFIDGDGCIKYQYKRKDVIISIKCHNSWIEWFKEIKYQLQFECAEPHINKKGYVVWNIGKKSILNKMSYHIKNNSLPVLTRKWSKVG